ncbi:MAG: LCP family protein [Pseudonocardia sp.]|nr:LCP family protein [Pseudonocardia sp.]
MADSRGRAFVAGTGRTLIALASVGVLLVTGYAWNAYRSLSAQLTTSDVLGVAAAPAARPDAPRQAFTALLVGLDSRTDAQGDPLPDDVLAQLHAGADDGQLHTDTIILLHVPASAAEPVVAVSFPRDSYVPIADGSGRHKINSAFGRGYRAAQTRLESQGITGAELDRRARDAGRRTLVDTVEAAAGITIGHYAEINLAGFVELTDTLGGVPVCLNSAVDDSAYSGVELSAGPQTVQGAGALAFVRQRHGLQGGDLDRITRQQAFLAGLTNQVLSTGTLTDPDRLAGLMTVITRYLVVDAGWDLDAVLGQLWSVSGADVVFRTIPTIRPDLQTPVDGVAVEVDDARVREFVGTVLTDDPRASDAETPTSTLRASGSASTTPRARPATAGSPVPSPPAESPTGPSTGTPGEPPSVRPVIDAGGVTCVD